MNPITKMRKEMNYSQTQLADLLGVSQSAVSQWELSKAFPDIKTAMTLALIFGVTIEDLLNESDYQPLQGIAKVRNGCGKLNDQGINKVLEYVEDLIATGKYKKASVEPNGDSDGND